MTLARAIDHLPAAKDGFVIALLGDWGTGKTSVLHLVARYLRHLEMERLSRDPVYPDEVAYPQSLDELERLACTFELIEHRIISVEDSDRSASSWHPVNRKNEFRRWLESDDQVNDADVYWRLRLTYGKRPQTAVVWFSPWLLSGRAELASALFSDMARALGTVVGEDLRKAIGSLLTRLSELAGVTGAGIDLLTGSGLGKLAASGLGLSRSLADKLTTGPTLDELRQRLRRALGSLMDQKIMIVVDDIDRLPPKEALEMISLIKSLGDLPNVLYFLCYEEKRLQGLLATAMKMESGSEFLEKIVQYSVHIPPVSSDDIYRLLASDLLTILGELQEDERVRLDRVWYYILRHYLTTPRNVKRIVNSFTMAHSALGPYTDPIDLLILEALRLFEPTVYDWIRTNVDDLTE
jgi:Cdc6-like AAA superfamily ATPase